MYVTMMQKITELDKWKQHNVYCEVLYHGQHLISLRLVSSLKEINTGFVPKARLVAKGFEDNKKNDITRKSPTCLRESLHIFIVFTSTKLEIKFY